MQRQPEKSFASYFILGSSVCINFDVPTTPYEPIWKLKNFYFLDDFCEKPCRYIGKFWGNVGAHRDILEIPCERGVRSTLGTPAHGISKMFLLTQSLPLSSWVLIELFYILEYPVLERVCVHVYRHI